jgi:hypothetical protein
MIRYSELRSAAGRYGIRQALHFTRSSSAKAKSLFAAVCAPDIQQRREARHIGQHCAGFTVLKPLFNACNEPALNMEQGPHMPWLANTFWQLLLSLVLFCCKHC